MSAGNGRCSGKTVGIRRRRATVKRPVRARTGQKARHSHCPATPGWEGWADRGEPLSQETGEVLPAATGGRLRAGPEGCGNTFIPRVEG
jgi:hypothetical protein